MHTYFLLFLWRQSSKSEQTFEQLVDLIYHSNGQVKPEAIKLFIASLQEAFQNEYNMKAMFNSIVPLMYSDGGRKGIYSNLYYMGHSLQSDWMPNDNTFSEKWPISLITDSFRMHHISSDKKYVCITLTTWISKLVCI